ncbi:MAG: hypothetical protein SCH98_14800 [Deferrisomatales bacterium]|nr:hypothetical protein [Deferrisomatales bacterium]
MPCFTDADRKKKGGRIQLPENPGNLSADALSRLEDAVRAAVREGGVPCAGAWTVARQAGVSRLDVGVAVDRLGLRVTDCQLGCFQVSKTPYAGPRGDAPEDETARRVAALQAAGGLTCAAVFELARELGRKPLVVADAANVRGYKIRECQLGCF